MKHIATAIVLMLSACVKLESEPAKETSEVKLNKEYYSCINGTSDSQGDKYIFSPGDKLIIDVVIHEGLNCDSSKKKERHIYSGTYSFDVLTGVYTEDIHKLEVAFTTAAEVSQRNADAYCSRSDWTLGRFVDITDNDDCAGGTVYSNATPVVYNGTVMTDRVFNYGHGVWVRIK